MNKAAAHRRSERALNGWNFDDYDYAGCSCHINPPCSWCTESYECTGCGQVNHPSESEPFTVQDKIYCEDCQGDLNLR